jgi:hypothetical protein
MFSRSWLACLVAVAVLAPTAHDPPADACCPAYPSGSPVVNADQTVIILWDAATKTQHFIRQASFKSAAADFGFLIPSPTRPELDESGNEAFPYLRTLTEPTVEVRSKPSSGFSFGCAQSPTVKPASSPPPVTVLEEKRVAGFDAVVLKAESADALVDWLKAHKYEFSPEVKAWAAPYVERGWNITALKVAKDAKKTEQQTAASDNTVAAAALRMSFKTDQPLFPYREPDSIAAAESLGAKQRLLRIYFLSDARYKGSLGVDNAWSGRVAWAGPLTELNRREVLQRLRLPEMTGPAGWWLTEFEDNWAYQVAPADLTFSKDPSQTRQTRPPIIHYTATQEWPRDVTLYAMFAAVVMPPLLVRWRRWLRR